MPSMIWDYAFIYRDKFIQVVVFTKFLLQLWHERAEFGQTVAWIQESCQQGADSSGPSFLMVKLSTIGHVTILGGFCEMSRFRWDGPGLLTTNSTGGLVTVLGAFCEMPRFRWDGPGFADDQLHRWTCNSSGWLLRYASLQMRWSQFTDDSFLRKCCNSFPWHFWLFSWIQIFCH